MPLSVCRKWDFSSCETGASSLCVSALGFRVWVQDSGALRFKNFRI